MLCVETVRSGQVLFGNDSERQLEVLECFLDWNGGYFGVEPLVVEEDVFAQVVDPCRSDEVVGQLAELSQVISRHFAVRPDEHVGLKGYLAIRLARLTLDLATLPQQLGDPAIEICTNLYLYQRGPC